MTTMPKWPTRRLDEVVSLRRGHDLTWRDRRPGRVPVMGSAGANGTHDQAIAGGPGVVLGRSGASYGQAHYVDVDYWPHNTALYTTDFHGNDPRFIYYVLDLIDFSSYNSGGAQQSLNRNFIAGVLLDIPEGGEQRKIATAIDDAGRFISTLERLVAKKQALKEGMMQQLLTGKTRLHDFVAPWRVETIGALCTMRSGSPKKRVAGGQYWVVDMGSVTREAEFVVTRKTNDVSGVLRLGELVMPKDDIGGGNIIGRTGLIEREATYVLADHVYALTPRGIDPVFLNFAINGHQVNASLRSQATGSAQLGLSRQSVLKQEVTFPSEPEEQRAIAGALADATTEIADLRDRLTKANAIKTGMMEQLLTGRIRLPMEVAS